MLRPNQTKSFVVIHNNITIMNHNSQSYFKVFSYSFCSICPQFPLSHYLLVQGPIPERSSLTYKLIIERLVSFIYLTWLIVPFSSLFSPRHGKLSPLHFYKNRVYHWNLAFAPPAKFSVWRRPGLDCNLWICKIMLRSRVISRFAYLECHCSLFRTVRT